MLNDKKVYIVMGSTGCYSDWTQWSVKAFLTEPAANEFAKKAQARADEIHERIRKSGNRYSYPTDPAFLSEFDPHFRDDDGVSYSVDAVPLDSDT